MASSALICAIVPWIVTELVPLPETLVTPLVPAVTLSVPSVTLSVTDTWLMLASASLTDRPLFLRLSTVCSVAL